MIDGFVDFPFNDLDVGQTGEGQCSVGIVIVEEARRGVENSIKRRFGLRKFSPCGLDVGEVDQSGNDIGRIRPGSDLMDRQCLVEAGFSQVEMSKFGLDRPQDKQRLRGGLGIRSDFGLANFQGPIG